MESTFKAVYNPKTDECRLEKSIYTCHADLIGSSKDFDRWVRLIVWPELKRVYIRGYKPNGYYDKGFTDDELDLAYRISDKAITYLITKKIIKKSWKVLFWQTDRVITPEMVRL